MKNATFLILAAVTACATGESSPVGPERTSEPEQTTVDLGAGHTLKFVGSPGYSGVIERRSAGQASVVEEFASSSLADLYRAIAPEAVMPAFIQESQGMVPAESNASQVAKASQALTAGATNPACAAIERRAANKRGEYPNGAWLYPFDVPTQAGHLNVNGNGRIVTARFGGLDSSIAVATNIYAYDFDGYEHEMNYLDSIEAGEYLNYGFEFPYDAQVRRGNAGWVSFDIAAAGQITGFGCYGHDTAYPGCNWVVIDDPNTQPGVCVPDPPTGPDLPFSG